MTNAEAINELQSAIDLIKQDGKDWLDERDIPVLETAISALQAQDSPKPTAGSVQNVQNEDLISRKAAIDAAESAFVRGVFPTPYIRELPSAQPEIRTQMSSANLISRQEAIDAVEILLEKTEEDADVKTWNNAIRGAINSIKHHVPSAQPEQKTCVGCVHENQKGWCIDVCGGCVRNAVDHYRARAEEGAVDSARSEQTLRNDIYSCLLFP